MRCHKTDGKSGSRLTRRLGDPSSLHRKTVGQNHFLIACEEPRDSAKVLEVMTQFGMRSSI